MNATDSGRNLTPLRFDRRNFLKLAAASSAGLVLAEAVHSRVTAQSAAASTAIADLAFGLEFDRERIFRFVADEIRYEPYAGVLRGAEGTLMARAGNAADQAVLLAALLNVSGIEYRFAEGPLRDEDADALRAGASIDVEAATREFLEAVSGTGEGGKPLLPDGAAGDATGGGAATGPNDVEGWARSRFFDTAALIEGALAEASIEVSGAFSPMPALERERHLWVQAALGPDWLDLDPSYPSGPEGAAHPAASATFAEIPSELRHRLTFTVVAEVVRGGSLQHESLLEVDEFADVLAGVPVGILNIEQEGLKAVGANIATALEGGLIYLPLIVAGEDVVVGPGPIRFGGTGADPFGEPPPGTGPSDGEATAEWVRVTVLSPGAEPQVVEREIFDRVGPAARERGTVDLASIAPVELLALEPGGPPEFLPAQRSHWLTVHTGTFGGDALGQALIQTEVEDRLTNLTHLYHLVRESTGLELGASVGTRMFATSPNLVATVVDLERDADASLAVRVGLDIVHQALGTSPLEATPLLMPPGLAAGINAHLAERMLMGEAGVAAASATGPESVGALFEAAQAQGIGLRAVSDVAGLDASTYPADALARLGARLRAGLIAVLPERSVLLGDRERLGWWLVDPVTGTVFDEMDIGRGAVFGESTTIRMGPVRAAPAYRRLALCAAIAALVAGNLVGSITGALAFANGAGPMALAANLLGGVGAGVGGAAAATGGC